MCISSITDYTIESSGTFIFDSSSTTPVPTQRTIFVIDDELVEQQSESVHLSADVLSSSIPARLFNTAGNVSIADNDRKLLWSSQQ